jgi:hypothetical protein
MQKLRCSNQKSSFADFSALYINRFQGACPQQLVRSLASSRVSRFIAIRGPVSSSK